MIQNTKSYPCRNKNSSRRAAHTQYPNGVYDLPPKTPHNLHSPPSGTTRARNQPLTDETCQITMPAAIKSPTPTLLSINHAPPGLNFV